MGFLNFLLLFQSYSIPDSVTLTPGPWFGVPGLPTVVSFIIWEKTQNSHETGLKI